MPSFFQAASPHQLAGREPLVPLVVRGLRLRPASSSLTHAAMPSIWAFSAASAFAACTFCDAAGW